MNQTHHPVKDSIKSILFLYLISTAFSQALPAQAQITPDNTLSSEASRLNQNQIINGASGDEIDGGATRGSNLFHSFSEFNIKDGQRVYFANPTGVENILTRVTGGNASNIFGTLGVTGAANLFLINPAGILFGQNAQLDVQGSFVGTTGDGIKFADANFFSASNNQGTSLLTVSVPIGIQMGANPGTIIVQGNGHNLTYDSSGGTVRGDVKGLQVQPGRTLALIGGDIILKGGNLRAETGRIELGSVASPGLVSLTQNDYGLTFGYSGVENFGNILLSQKASVDASGGGGSIQVQSSQLSVKDGSSILSINSGAKPGGDFTVNATESVELIGESADQKYASAILTESQGNGSSGNLTINTKKLTATDGAYVSTFITSSGNGGNLTVKATDSVELLGEGIFRGGLYTGTSFGSSGNAGNLRVETQNLDVKNSATVYANTVGQGDGGNITITTSSLDVLNGAQLSASTFGTGDAGSIEINATGAIKFDGEDKDGNNSGAYSRVNSGAEGKAGGVAITTGSLDVLNGAQLSASTFGKGDAGNITITARDAVSFDGVDSAGFPSGAYSRVESENAIGQGGNISITTGSLSFTKGGLVATSTLGRGDAGNITITARDAVSFDGAAGIGTSSGAFSPVGSEAIGQGGNISISTGVLSLSNGGQVGVFTFGQGNAGNITITARDTVSFDGASSDGFASAALSSVESGAVGQGGNIRITTGSLSAINGSGISASTSGQGNAGNITITARDTVSFDGGSSDGIGSDRFPSGAFTSVEPGAEGQGGRVKVNTGLFTITNEAELSASSEGQGDAGNLEVNARQLRLDNKGAIQAQTASGQGGNITLQVQDLLLLRRGSKISTTAGTAQAGGNGGNITFDGKFIVAIPNEDSDISANAFRGNGGNIQINSQGIFGIESRPEPTQKSDITASSELGISGVININTPDNSSIQNSFTQLSPNVIDTNALIANSCISRGTKRQENSFTITGSGALRNSPGDVLISAYTTGDVRNVEPTSRTWKKGDPIIEPQGLYRLPDGRLLLSRACV